MNRDVLIRTVDRVEGRHEDLEWPWALENQVAIDANWARRKAAKPRMFNGRVLVVRRLDLAERDCRMVYSEVDFKDFLGWLDLGQPDGTIANGFAAGALQGSDGAFICGVMADHTANAGRVYFPAGTPDRSDMRPDGSVDLPGSLEREMVEETGLPDEAYVIREPWIVIRVWPALALVRYVALRETAEEVALRIRASIAEEAEPELSDVRIIRGVDDIDATRMPLYVQHFFRWHFARREP